MRGKIVYLDSSAIVKRYVKESGSKFVRSYYLKAYSGELELSYSFWNIGEVLGAFDRARQLHRLDEESFRIVRERFLLETRRVAKLGIAVIVPVKTRILVEAWKLIEGHHIYEADALQIATAKHLNAEEFLTADRKLHEIAEKENLNSIYVS